ncbi:hypothetical protein BSL78_10358 [Apostichopus japonicus]|uniref:AB hydrolase-1 domain-containing protein n=1 Tax=Stichopus japonicus TaxID=307972 RepID=A0A2G8KXN8_STIJA|nr:hypothetical protein BSL78_10358 [Apostichopus japonicus]
MPVVCYSVMGLTYMCITEQSKWRSYLSEVVPYAAMEVNGVKFHYQETGKGDHVVLLIPGALGSSKSDYQPQFAKLNKEKFRLIGIDPRGYGKTRPPDRDFPLDFFQRDADDAAGLMSALGHKSYSVLGWSDGGIVATILAAKYHDSLRKLVVWGSNAYFTEKDSNLFEKTRNIDDWSKRMKDPMIEQYGEDYFRKTWAAWIDGVTEIIEEKKGDVCMAECRQIHKPTLILHGDHDPMVPQEHPVYLQNNIRGSRLIRFPDGKHNIHLRYADVFNRHVEDFLLKEE